jgi:hypothetical protein
VQIGFLTRSQLSAATLAVVALLGADATAQTAAAPKPAALQLSRWFELQNATLNLRYRFIDTSAGVTATNQMQYRQVLRGRLKFDSKAKYTLNLGLFTGTRFTSGWDNTGWGTASAQKNLAFRAIYFAAQPVRGLEAQYGGLLIIRGQSTEVTTYDEDGYVIGQRITLRRPELHLDELSATVGYLSSDAREIGISKRTKYLNDTPNYRHFLAGRKFGRRTALSVDFTSANGANTWRQGVNVKTPELHVIDTIVFENYQRTNRNADHGFALTLDKAVHTKISVNGGYASIDPLFGGLNSDRFNIGNRVFGMITCNISPEFLASWFVTRAVGNGVPLPQRTLTNLVFTYNALPALRRTGLF